MENIKTLRDLKQHILLLELEKENRERCLVHEFEKTCEKLSPVNLLKRQVNKWTGGSDFSKTLIQAGMTVLAGYVSKKMEDADDSHPIKKMCGMFLQFGSVQPVSDETK
jgi:hypothetical protein